MNTKKYNYRSFSERARELFGSKDPKEKELGQELLHYSISWAQTEGKCLVGMNNQHLIEPFLDLISAAELLFDEAEDYQTSKETLKKSMKEAKTYIEESFTIKRN